MNFPQALSEAIDGKRVARTAWNGLGTISICREWEGHLLKANTASPRLTRFIYIETRDGNIGPWTPTQNDMLSTDWQFAL